MVSELINWRPLYSVSHFPGSVPRARGLFASGAWFVLRCITTDAKTARSDRFQGIGWRSHPPTRPASPSRSTRKSSRARYGRNGGITAVTFYDGEAVAAAAYAKGKLREVLEANPWIAGQLVKQALVHLKAGVCIVPKAAFGASEGGPQTLHGPAKAAV